MKRAIVTGAGGFLGAALTRTLAEGGVAVTALIRPGGQAPEAAERCVPLELDAYAGLASAVGDGGYDAFYHLAWAGTAGAARQDVALQRANVQAALRAQAAAARLGCERFVFAGSVFEARCRIEEELSSPAQCYTSAKLCAHLSLALQGEGFVCALLSNVYGVGERSGRFLCATLSKLLRGERPRFTDGKQAYDFLYIDDAARALALLGEKGRRGQGYYIGNAETRPLREFIRVLYDCVRPPFPLILGERPPETESVDFDKFDRGKLQREFGFAPAVSFAEGIERTARWLRGEEEDDCVSV